MISQAILEAIAHIEARVTNNRQQALDKAIELAELYALLVRHRPLDTFATSRTSAAIEVLLEEYRQNNGV